MKTAHALGLIAASLLPLTVVSCSTGGRSPSGFLADFKQLDAGYGTTDSVAAYVNPKADLKKYDSVIIEPVTTVIATPGIDAAVTEQVAAYLGAALRSQVAGGLKLTTVPGPTTLRVRTALTDVIPGVAAGKPVTIVHQNPQANLVGPLGSPEVAAFLAKLSFEGELRDSVTGERVSAMADHRIGTKREWAATTTWAEIRSATRQGAERLYQRILAAKKS